MTVHHESMIMLAIGRLEGKMDMALTLQKVTDEKLKDHDARLDDQDGRIAKLEVKWGFVAAVTVGALSLLVLVLENFETISGFFK